MDLVKRFLAPLIVLLFVVAAAVTVFGGERVPFPKPPRELAERCFTLTRWAEHDRGGHFPAVAEPQLLAETLRDAFRPLR